MAKNEVATKEENIPQLSDMDEALALIEDDDNISSEDIAIPRITILQDMSPQIKKSKPEYIEGSEVGDICDVGLGEIIPKPMHFLPVYFQKIWIEWAPRSSDKSLIAIHTDYDKLPPFELDEDGKMMHGENLIAETMQFFGLNLSANGRESYIGMTSSALKQGKKWTTFKKAERVTRKDGMEVNPPWHYRSYIIGTADENNNKGDWTTWKIERGPKLSELPNAQNVLQRAAELYDMCKAGKAQADMSDEINNRVSQPAMKDANSDSQAM